MDDGLGGVSFHPWFGGSFFQRAAVRGLADGTHSSSSALPTRLTFHSGASVATERGRVDALGSFEMDSWVGFNGKTAAAPPNYTRSGAGTNRSIDYATSTAAQVREVLATLVQDLIDIGLLQ